MSQTYASATFLPLPHPLELPPSRTPAPSQEKLPTLNVDIQDGREEQRYSLLLGEQYSQRDDVVEVIWEREQQRLKEREAAQNKFATLFEPPTPRASPTLSPSPLPQSTTTSLPLFTHPRPTPLKRHPWRISRPDSVSSNSSSDFGSFVTTTEDPLSFSLTHETSIESGSVGGDTTPLATEAGTLFDIFFDILFTSGPRSFVQSRPGLFEKATTFIATLLKYNPNLFRCVHASCKTTFLSCAMPSFG